MIILPLLCLMIIPSVARATIITGCTFDKAVYSQGEPGNLTVTIHNDEENKIRVTVLTAAIDYFYTDGSIYMQTFYSDETLPIEIQQGQSDSLEITFSLPNNIAPGYIEVFVKAQTEQWNNHSQTWFGSDHPNYRPTLYVESPYKHQFEEEQAINTTTTNMMYLLGITTMIFAVITGFLVMLNRKARAVRQPVT